MKLYYMALSGHSHRAHLFLSLIGVPHDLVPVDLGKGAQKVPEFLAMNRFGQVPVLDDGGTIVADSNAILVYAALKYGRTDWLPNEPVAMAQVQRWLSVAAGQIAYGPAAARLVTVFGAKFNSDEVIARAHAVLGVIEATLAERQWLAADRPTLADVALYSYVARAPEGNVDLSRYTHVHSWLARIEALTGFVPFQRTAVGLEAAA